MTIRPKFFGPFSFGYLLLGVILGMGISWMLGMFSDEKLSPNTRSQSSILDVIEETPSRINQNAKADRRERRDLAPTGRDTDLGALEVLSERFEQALLLPVGLGRSDSLLRLVSEACGQSPRFAFDKLLPELDGLDAHNALTEIAVSWAEADPSGALEAAKTLGDEEATTAVAELALFELSKLNPSEALSKMQDFKDRLSADGYDNLQNGFLAGWALTSPIEAINYYTSIGGGASTEETEKFLVTVVGNGALSEPASTLAAVKKSFTGATLDTALKVTYSAWSSSDPAAAAKSLETMQAGPVADEIAMSIAREWSQYEPQTTIEWVNNAANISDSARIELLENLDPTQNELGDSEPEALPNPE